MLLFFLSLPRKSRKLKDELCLWMCPRITSSRRRRRRFCTHLRTHQHFDSDAVSVSLILGKWRKNGKCRHSSFLLIRGEKRWNGFKLGFVCVNSAEEMREIFRSVVRFGHRSSSSSNGQTAHGLASYELTFTSHEKEQTGFLPSSSSFFSASWIDLVAGNSSLHLCSTTERYKTEKSSHKWNFGTLGMRMRRLAISGRRRERVIYRATAHENAENEPRHHLSLNNILLVLRGRQENEAKKGCNYQNGGNLILSRFTFLEPKLTRHKIKKWERNHQQLNFWPVKKRRNYFLSFLSS